MLSAAEENAATIRSDAESVLDRARDDIAAVLIERAAAEAQRDSARAAFTAAQAEFDGGTVTTIDGIRVDFTDGWGLVRPSNTTPCLVLRFEADTQAALERVQGLFRERLTAIQADLQLPF